MSAASQTNQPRDQPGTAETARPTQYTVAQLYRTLRLCLRYVADGNDVFNRLLRGLGCIPFIPMLGSLSEEELRRLIPMLSQKLKILRLQVSDIPKLLAICRKVDVSQLVNTRHCELMAEKDSQNSAVEHIELLSEVLPNLEMLLVNCSIQGHFPLLEKVRTVRLNIASQATIEDLLRKCPQLENFELSDRNVSTSVFDMQNLGLCKRIKHLRLPLDIKSPLAICHLENLKHLSLQCKRLWPESAWLPTVVGIIQAKRFALERLTIDGTWLVGSLIVSKLQLVQCTALKELRLSNCKVIDGVGYPLPFICQKLSFRKCTLNMIQGFLATQQMLKHVELFQCQVEWRGTLLRHIVDLTKRRPGPAPLHFNFSQCARLRSEYTKWTMRDLEASKPWLQVREVKAETWKQPLGMITMEFGRLIDHSPNVLLPLESVPVAAVILEEFDQLVKD